MVDIHVSERDEIETLKRWWKDNGTAVVLGLVVGLGGLFGWQYWQAYQAARAERASIGFQDLMASLIDQDSARAREVGAKLMSEHGDSGYAALAALALAGLSVDEGKEEEARARLLWVVEHGRPEALVHVARLRLARLALAGGDTAVARSHLEALPPLNEDTAYQELRGDLLAAEGRRDEARTAYLRAIELAAARQMDAGDVELKLDALGRQPGP